MRGWLVAALVIGGYTSFGGGCDWLTTFSPAADLPFDLSPAAAEDRRRLMEAVKKASRCGEKGRLTAADFDAVVNLTWGRKAAHLYILPLDLEDALLRHDAANPDAKFGGPPLDFRAVDKNLILCVGGVHDMLQEALGEYLTGLVGKKVGSADIGRVLVDHLKGLPAKDRAEFLAKLVAAQGWLRSAAKESKLGLVSDETDCAKVMERVNRLGAEPVEVRDRIAAATKEFKAAFAKSAKAADSFRK